MYLQESWPKGNTTAFPVDEGEAAPLAAEDGIGTRFMKSPPLHDATFLYAVLPFALNQARRHQEALSLVCVSVDRLAGIKELMGHAVADELVNSVGETVAASIRTSDIVARLDDDRIIAVLPRAPGGGALYVGKKICEAVAHKRHLGYEIDGVTVSIGVATFPLCAEDVFSLFDAADFALVRAETEGRNRACLAPRRSAITTTQSEAASS